MPSISVAAFEKKVLGEFSFDSLKVLMRNGDLTITPQPMYYGVFIKISRKGIVFYDGRLDYFIQYHNFLYMGSVLPHTEAYYMHLVAGYVSTTMCDGSFIYEYNLFCKFSYLDCEINIDNRTNMNLSFLFKRNQDYKHAYPLYYLSGENSYHLNDVFNVLGFGYDDTFPLQNLGCIKASDSSVISNIIDSVPTKNGILDSQLIRFSHWFKAGSILAYLFTESVEKSLNINLLDFSYASKFVVFYQKK